jgi:hypothetical protein
MLMLLIHLEGCLDLLRTILQVCSCKCNKEGHTGDISMVI